MKPLRLITIFILLYLIIFTAWLHFSQQSTFVRTILTHWIAHAAIAFATSIIAWTAAYFVYDLYESARFVKPDSKAILITGCDTGFGHLAAVRLDRIGFHVFAGVLSLDGEGAKRLKRSCSDRLCLLQINVTKADDVRAGIDTIRKANIPLWAVVNNAGITTQCPFDWGADCDEYRRVLDVNLFGMIRVTKFAIPLLRQINGSRVINIVSVAGRLSSPFAGHYCVAKFGARAFCDHMRRELRTLQHHNPDHSGNRNHANTVHVVSLEPTLYRTPIFDQRRLIDDQQRIWSQTSDDIRSAYHLESITTLLNDASDLANLSTRPNVSEVIDTIVRAAMSANPKPIYRCCGYNLAMWIGALLPEILIDLAFDFVTANRAGKAIAKFTMRVCSFFQFDRSTDPNVSESDRKGE